MNVLCVRNHSGARSSHSHKECSLNLFPVTSSYSCIILAGMDSSPTLSNMLYAEINIRIPNFLVVFRWNALFAKDFSKYLTSLLICRVPDRTLLSAAETQCSLKFCCSIFEFYVFTLQLIAASFVVSCALRIESDLREDFCLKNCCSFYLNVLYASVHPW